MTQSEERQGFSNYETYSVALIIDNDEVAQEQARRLAKAEYVEAHDADDALKDWLEAAVEVPAGTFPECMRTQLLGAALGRVNWREIAEYYRGEGGEA
jgi:hypothetical protein